MWACLMKGAIRVVVSVAVMAGVTAALWYAKHATIRPPHHPVFFYLLPIALVSFLYGSRTAILCAVAAVLCSAFFLYDPLYSFSVANRLEFGELICFTVLALIGAKCMVELLRPDAKLPTASATNAELG
jgi:K+-sensing histidine kinase KdpD